MNEESSETMSTGDRFVLESVVKYFKDMYGLDLYVRDRYNNKIELDQNEHSKFLLTIEGEYIRASEIVRYSVTSDTKNDYRYYKVFCKHSDGTVHVIKTFSNESIARLYLKELIKDYD